MEAASAETSTRELWCPDSSSDKIPESLENWPFTLEIIMCLTLNSATEWAGSTFQVVVEICGAATVAVVMVHSFLSLIDLRIFIDAISIDIDIYDGDYNDEDSDSYGSEEKGSGSDSYLAGHAEGVAVDRSLSASHN